ncbi:MAG: hypothetical protein AAFV29_05960, partial [Myxococcota bacterium]
MKNRTTATYIARVLIGMSALIAAGCVGSAEHAKSTTNPVSESAEHTTRLERLMAEFWEAYTAELPTLANTFGDLSHTDKLDQMSEAAFERRRRMF